MMCTMLNSLPTHWVPFSWWDFLHSSEIIYILSWKHTCVFYFSLFPPPSLKSINLEIQIEQILEMNYVKMSVWLIASQNIWYHKCVTGIKPLSPWKLCDLCALVILCNLWTKKETQQEKYHNMYGNGESRCNVRSRNDSEKVFTEGRWLVMSHLVMKDNLDNINDLLI